MVPAPVLRYISHGGASPIHPPDPTRRFPLAVPIAQLLRLQFPLLEPLIPAIVLEIPET